MTSSTHGGQRPGAGRPKLFQATKNNYLILERETIGGEIRKPELVKVLSVGENEIELQSGNDLIVLRFPDDDEITIRDDQPPT
jgi:hypothetical protein